ncbi:MAG TPA: Flp pilus assembly protein CpaB [Candidatus Sulfopaludibacter sp.]|jgi:pilus assembly protein CpaB|nr:Flp pilus assembly protein CpaB [Candidatus Sulfopaludibacter sp.]
MDRQKKLLIFGACWVSAALLTWFVYATAVAPRADKQVRVVVAARDMPLGALLRPGDLKLASYLEKDAPKGVVLKTSDAVNRVVLFPFQANEPLLAAKLSGTTTVEGLSSTIDPGYRAVAVQITDQSGVAGLIQPNSRVDVLFTRPGTMTEASTSTILQNVRVLSVGRLNPTGTPVDPRAQRSPVVTLVLAPEDAQKLELAKNEGRISLSLRNPTDNSRAEATGPITTEVLDPTLTDRIEKSRKKRGSVGDDQTWKALTAKKEAPKEPPKPRAVVDVYRGDKHVQESFR